MITEYKQIAKLILLGIGILIGVSCTDLSENLYSEIPNDNFYNNEKEVQSAVLRPYTHARAWDSPTTQRSYWMLNEYTADQLARPQKGIHGYDGGDWIRLHYHTWNSQDKPILNPWQLIFGGIGYCNNAIENIRKKSALEMNISESSKSEYLAELRAFRAYHYLKLMDLYGNIPIVTIVGEPESPPTRKREEVYAFIESEIIDVVDELPLLSSNNVGRMTRAGAYATLASLYLNSVVYTGNPEWDKCVKACDEIISGASGSQLGTLNLDSDINIAFSNNNTNDSHENLFVYAYDYQKSPNRLIWNYEFYHYNQKEVYGGDLNGWNAAVIIPSAYDAFSSIDKRRADWILIGKQYYYNEPERPILGSFEYQGKPLEFVREIQRNSEGKTTSSMTEGEENSGARFNKYKSGPLSDPNYWNNDWVSYRLTEIYFMKAEALMRKNGSATQEAVDLINKCRIRAFDPSDWTANAYSTQTLTFDELLDERGREFIFEGKRRTDLIRFGKYNTATWWDHKPSNSSRSLFPIPYEQLIVNPNLDQNEGY